VSDDPWPRASTHPPPDPDPNPSTANVLATLPLVSEGFWRAAHREFGGAEWFIDDPNAVRSKTPHFHNQWSIGSRLLTILATAGARHGSVRTDGERVKAAEKIRRKSHELRQLLNLHTGYTDEGESRGLHVPGARWLLETAGRTGDEARRAGGDTAFAVAPLGIGPGTIDGLDHQILNGTTLPDLLIALEDHITAHARDIKYAADGSNRQNRFIAALEDWLMCRRHTSDASERGHLTPCRDTAGRILTARYPDVEPRSNAGCGPSRRKRKRRMQEWHERKRTKFAG